MGDNRRKVYIRLTEQGQSFIEEEQRLVKERLSSKFNMLSQEDQETFHRAVDDILKILRKLE